MKELVLLAALAAAAFLTCQNASAITISAVPEKQEFGPNDWIKVDLTVQGYNGGPINWTIHRPDNSITSGALDQQVKADKIMHQIVRDAGDKEFGTWTIIYTYGGTSQTVHFDVQSLNLAVITDKINYYEPDTMNINITSSYYEPYSKFSHPYLLDFYDQDGNKAVGEAGIEVQADSPSVLYHFPMLKFAKYNPPGLYKLKVQYFNSMVETPFLLGDMRNLMKLSVKNPATFYQGSDVTLDIIFTKMTDSSGTVKVTDPNGNTTTTKFDTQSVHSTITLKGASKTIGTYKFEIDYAGVASTGSYKIVQSPKQQPNISVEVLPNKLNYRPGEIANFEVRVSNATAGTASTWVTGPDGKAGQQVFLPMNSTQVIIPYMIGQSDSSGQWMLHVDYDGIRRSAPFYVKGPAVDYKNILDAGQYDIPVFVLSINSSLKSPSGIAIDRDNNMYVTDSGDSEIKKFNADGHLLLSWSQMGSSSGQFRNPSGIFVSDKYVYVADTGNSRIAMFNKTGGFLYSWGTQGKGAGMFQTPMAIDSDHRGELFVGDAEQGTIQLFDSIGTYKDHIDSSLADSASFLGIKALAFDSHDNMYAVSTDNRILKYSDIGEFQNFYGLGGTGDGEFASPSAIAVDSKNSIYVADTGNHRIEKFDSNGNFLLSFGTQGSGDGQFEQPTGLAVDSNDNIYVVDKKNNNVQKFALYAAAGTNTHPSWIRSNAVGWSEGALDKNEFSLAVKYMINRGLIKTQSMSQSDNAKIPSWLKGNVEKWSSGQIDDQTFWAAIQYLVSTGTVKV